MNTYDTDFYQWIQEQLMSLKNHDSKTLDWDNLLVEIETLGKSELKTCESFVILIILHKLCLDYWTEELEKNQLHWQGEVQNFRIQLNKKLTQSIRNKLELDSLYLEAKEAFKQKSGLIAPDDCPYRFEELL
ncbi:protein of unknown function DUF29 [Rippkaea orientalis PCC 8801]|uniref:DUF29 domain-containing protein n=1 Tax=Rippkaea orientalis (strain PCC 8801 / RF-1) TaxID=41431 RepID=B7K2Y3_RIPO1|nr:DUF29 domain-containing protein [Rippkaea orientalis]ACK67684.1 protein of unknown function DUF29 [Rippkaea orientalis PCC 8801]